MHIKLFVATLFLGWVNAHYYGGSPLMTSSVHFPGSAGPQYHYPHQYVGGYGSPHGGSRYGNGFSGNGGIGIRQTGETLANVYGQPAPVPLGYGGYMPAAVSPLPYGAMNNAYNGYGHTTAYHQHGTYGTAHMPYMGK